MQVIYRPRNPAALADPTSLILTFVVSLTLMLAQEKPAIAAESDAPAGTTADQDEHQAARRQTTSISLDEVDTATGKMRRLLERYSTDDSILRRAYRIAMSPVQWERRGRFYQDWQELLDQIDFESLDQDGRIDYVLFANQLRHEQRQLDHSQRREAEVHPLVPFHETIVQFAEAHQAMQPIEPRAAAEQLAALVGEIGKVRQRVEAGLNDDAGDDAIKVKPVVANRAAGRVDALRATLARWHRFYDGYDPSFSWWTRDPHKKVNQELNSYAKMLRERVAGLEGNTNDQLIGDPIGREALLGELVHEMIPYTPEELIEIANREFAWCEAEMLRASRELGFGERWRDALEHVKTLHVEPGEQPALIKRLADEAVAFLDKHDLLTIPPLSRETWRMQMMSPDRQKVNPYFTGGEVISVSFPTDTMTHEQKLMSMRGNNIHFARATVHHELIPGHHLQGFMAARYRTHRRPFRTPFFNEGWALYWEMRLWDLDFVQSPEDRVGMLFWRTHRCARIIFSLSYHLEKMTAGEAIEFLIERVGHERNNATGEVRRSIAGSYGPLYQAAYMLGGMQLRSLHKELVSSGKMTDRQFHDAVLRENSIPVEMIRASLTDQPLSADFTTDWRFAGDVSAAD